MQDNVHYGVTDRVRLIVVIIFLILSSLVLFLGSPPLDKIIILLLIFLTFMVISSLLTNVTYESSKRLLIFNRFIFWNQILPINKIAKWNLYTKTARYAPTRSFQYQLKDDSVHL